MIHIFHYFVTTAHRAHHLAHVHDWTISHLRARWWRVFPGLDVK